MEKSKNLSRNVFLAIGIIVGILIFLLGSQLNANLGHAQKQEFRNEQHKNPNPIVKKFFS
jgi:nitrate/TMAO reductase-like tetraheme cytochrome c subunit